MNIEDLKKKIKKATSNKKTNFQNRGNAFGIAMRLGTEFVAAVFVASFIGFYLDKWLETTPFLMIIFFFIGAGTGILNVVRSSKMINKD
jgi:ATP synthase protein I|tara:strand:+ start:1677 stop:1943 length:267 start_codon:yes stop_codon:yes gene_type:complete